MEKLSYTFISMNDMFCKRIQNKGLAIHTVMISILFNTAKQKLELTAELESSFLQF